MSSGGHGGPSLRLSREPFGQSDSSHRESGALSKSLASDFSEVAKENRTGLGYLAYSNGTIYEGHWRNGERHGFGVCYYSSGNIYAGYFAEGVMEGEGTMFFANGDFFVGEFRRSQLHRGVLSGGGQEVKGVWEKGVCVTTEALETPTNLKRAHIALFTTIVTRVHDHFRAYGSENGIRQRFPQFPPGTVLAPPTDLCITGSPGAGSIGLAKDGPLNSAPSRRSRTVPPLNVPQPVAVASRGLSTSSVAQGDTAYPANEFTREPSSVFGVDDVEKNDLRAALTQPSSPEAVFVGALPACNEHFSLTRFASRVFVFLFPFLSLPWVPFAPLRITSLEEERQFVVSGSTLSRDFDSPTFSIFVVAVAVCCQVASIVIVACKVKLGKPQDGALSLPEMVIPCVLWLAVALFCGAYNAFSPVPHALERMDRKLTPKLAALAASVVDAKSSVCIYTWDEEGRGKVRNRHYRYRWLIIAVIFGSMMCLSAPSTRGGMGHGMFGAHGFEMAAALLAFFATFTFASVLTFYVLKLTDMQREVKAKLRVLTELASIESKSMVNASSPLRQPFDMDLSFDPTNLFRGFPGWFATRSLVLYGSACANHHSRSAAMSIFTLIIFFSSVVALSDVFKALAEDRLRSDQFYSTAHSYGLFVLFFWGILLFRYFNACTATAWELRTHQSIIDGVSLYHRVKLCDKEASEVIQMCSHAVARHDAKPQFFSGPLFPLLIVAIITMNVAGLAAIAFQLAEVIYY